MRPHIKRKLHSSLPVSYRLIHLALLIAVVVGVRACGGITVAEDRLIQGSRWVGEKTGFSQAQEKVKTDVAPAVGRATGSMYNRVQQGLATTLERAEDAAARTPVVITGTTDKAGEAVAGAVSGALSSPAATQGQGGGGAAPAGGSR